MNDKDLTNDWDGEESFDFTDNLDSFNPSTKKAAIARKRQIEDILEERRLQEELGDIEYLLSHRNRHKAHRRDKKRNE